MLLRCVQTLSENKKNLTKHKTHLQQKQIGISRAQEKN